MRHHYIIVFLLVHSPEVVITALEFVMAAVNQTGSSVCTTANEAILLHIPVATLIGFKATRKPLGSCCSETSDG